MLQLQRSLQLLSAEMTNLTLCTTHFQHSASCPSSHNTHYCIKIVTMWWSYTVVTTGHHLLHCMPCLSMTFVHDASTCASIYAHDNCGYKTSWQDLQHNWYCCNYDFSNTLYSLALQSASLAELPSDTSRHTYSAPLLYCFFACSPLSTPREGTYKARKRKIANTPTRC